jgi:hypothetical protein
LNGELEVNEDFFGRCLLQATKYAARYGNGAHYQEL